MKPLATLLFALTATTAIPVSGAFAQATEPKVVVLAAHKDPTQDAVLIGRTNSDGLALQLEIEGAEAMWVPMGTPAKWREHAPAKGERYHVEFKITDLATKTRLPYALITFAATNKDNGKTVKLVLPPMWGSSGLHYSENSALAGDGTYSATVTVGVPSFAREMKDKALWSKPVIGKFHFKLKDGKVIEVSEPSAAPS
jgi:Fe2+ transport protein